MYNGQFFKGLIHVVVFAVLISAASSAHGGLDVFFGLMIPAWVLYQAFEAYHVARARRDGEPLPDPLGLNEVSHWLNLGPKHPPAGGAVPPNPGAGAPYTAAGTYQAGTYQAGQYQAASQPGYQAGTQPGYQGTPYTPYVDPNLPPVPPPAFWHRREPIGAIILIALGILFLLNQISGMVWRFAWPVFLIGLGVWLMLRRMDDSKGGPQ